MMKDYQIQATKRNYPKGTQVELESMSGEPQMPHGLQGTVEHVDDAGQIHVKWRNGSSLALVPGEDSFRKIEPEVDLKAPFYRYNENEAKNIGEMDRWRESHIANIACARYIDSAETGLMVTAFDGFYVDKGGAYCRDVIEKFGYQRTMCVLASTINTKQSDGRITLDNKQWSDYHVYQLDEGQTRQYAINSVHPGVLDIFTKSVRKAYDKLGLYTHEHCILDSRTNMEFENRVLVVKPERLKESYWQPENQIFLAQSGFGCDPNAGGRAVYGTYLIDGEDTRRNRDDFIGVMKDEHIPEWVHEKLEQMNQPEQEQEAEPENDEGMEMTIQ